MNKTYTKYQIVDGSSAFSEDGYSKYYDRLRRADAGEFSRDDVYGYDQVVEHANEIRNSVHGGEMHYLESTLTIQVVVTIITTLPVDPIADPVEAYIKDFMRTPDAWALPEIWIERKKKLTPEQKDDFTIRVADQFTEAQRSVMSHAATYIYERITTPIKEWAATAPLFKGLPVLKRMFFVVVENSVRLNNLVTKATHKEEKGSFMGSIGRYAIYDTPFEHTGTRKKIEVRTYYSDNSYLVNTHFEHTIGVAGDYAIALNNAKVWASEHQ